MNYKCYNCGTINYVPDSEIHPGSQNKFFCSNCGTPNVISFDGSGQNNEYTQYDNMPNASMPPQMMPPRQNNSGNKTLNWVLVGLAVAIGIFAIYYFFDRQDKKTDDPQLIEEDQELVIRTFYNECVFGTPTVKMVEEALTTDMIEKVKESDTRFAMYKFLTGKTVSGSGSSSLQDIVSLGENRFRVNYLDSGKKGSSIVTLEQDGDNWKIDDVEFIDDQKVEKVEKKVEEEKTVTYNDSYDYSGSVDEYPISGTITFTPSGNGYRVSGKYAYQSTLRKYGNKNTSWIHVNGRANADGSIYWSESIVGNPDYDSHFNGTYTPDFSHIEGPVGASAEHYLMMDN